VNIYYICFMFTCHQILNQLMVIVHNINIFSFYIAVVLTFNFIINFFSNYSSCIRLFIYSRVTVLPTKSILSSFTFSAGLVFKPETSFFVFPELQLVKVRQIIISIHILIYFTCFFIIAPKNYKLCYSLNHVWIFTIFIILLPDFCLDDAPIVCYYNY